MPGQLEEKVYLGLGGNLGEPDKAMGAALRMLDADPSIRIVAVSSLYRTPPWGKVDQPDFLNAAAELTTSLSPRELLNTCLAVERKLKRVRQERWGPRLIDIDILVFGTRAIRENGLEIPHPRMLERAFVLAPLVEIAPNFEFRSKTFSDWLEALDVTGIEREASGPSWWKTQDSPDKEKPDPIS